MTDFSALRRTCEQFLDDVTQEATRLLSGDAKPPEQDRAEPSFDTRQDTKDESTKDAESLFTVMLVGEVTFKVRAHHVTTERNPISDSVMTVVLRDGNDKIVGLFPRDKLLGVVNNEHCD